MRILLPMLAVALVGASDAIADDALLTTLEDPRSAAAPVPHGPVASARAESFAEDFESFRLGRLSFQGGWMAAGNANIFNASSEPAFGALAVTRRSGLSGDFGSVAISPAFSRAVGSLSVDVKIINDDGTVHFLSSFSNATRLVNTRLRFAPGGAIQALGPDPEDPENDLGVFLETRGAWTEGEATRITIEVTPSAGLLVRQDGQVIYGGADLSAQRLPALEPGFDQVVFSQQETGQGLGIMRFDNILVDGLPQPNADLNGDGSVGAADLGILIGLWGPVFPE